MLPGGLKGVRDMPLTPGGTREKKKGTTSYTFGLMGKWGPGQRVKSYLRLSLSHWGKGSVDEKNLKGGATGWALNKKREFGRGGER